MTVTNFGELEAVCGKCGHTIAIDEANPPKDDDVVTCGNCGEIFGFYSLFRERFKKEAHAKAVDWFNETFVRKPGK